MQKKFTTAHAGRELTLETVEVAGHANGSVLV